MRAVPGVLEKIGAQGGFDQVDEPAQDAVFIEAVHRIQAAVERLQDTGGVCLGPIGPRRVEHGLEQGDDLAGQGRVVGQGLLHVGLGKRDTRLAQIFAIGPEDDHLAPGEPGAQHQAVEPVALHVAAPDAAEGVVKVPADGAQVHRGAVAGLEPEVVDHHQIDAGIVGTDDVGNLVHHHQTHVLEHGQDLGQGDRRVGMIDLEPQLVVGRPRGPVQVHSELAAVQGFLDHGDVGDRLGGVVSLAVAQRERVLVTPEKPEALPLAACGDQRIGEMIGPRTRRFDQLGFDLFRVVVGNPARRGADYHVHPRQRLIAEQGVESRNFAGERVFQDLLGALPERRRVTVARHVQEARDEPFEIVPAQEQGHPLAVLKVQDAHGGVEQLPFGDLKQFVAGKGFHDIEQGLAVMAGGQESGPRAGLLQLAAQQRNVAGAPVVRGGREQADEHALADHLAFGVEALDSDGIHVDRAVDCGLAVGLGDHQQLGPADEGAHFRGHGGQVLKLPENQEFGIAQDAQARLAVYRNGGAFAAALDQVFAETQESEVIVVDPAQEIPDLGHVLRRHIRRRRLQFLDDRRHRVTNGPPVLDGGADVADDRLHGGGNFGQPFAGLPGDLEMHEGFGADSGLRLVGLHQSPQPSALVAAHLEDRVDDHVNGQPLAIELGGDGIDQERHVVGDDLDHRAVRPPAVFFYGRVVDAHGRLAGSAGGPELPVRQRGAE